MIQRLMNPHERTQKIIIALFFSVLLLIGLATAADYGISSDEHRELQTLRMHEREYINSILGTYNEFEHYFVSVGAYENYKEYADRDYGSAAFYPIAPFLIIQKVSPFLKMVVWHCYIFLLFLLGCYALYSITFRLFHSRRLACIGVLFLYLSPRFFAEGHYNSKDTVMMALVLLLLWLGLQMMRTPTFRRALLLGLAGAIATNQRVIGLFIWGLICFFVLIYHLVHKTLTPKTLMIGATSLISLFAFYYILTPSAWGQPWMNLPSAVSSLSHFSRLDSSILFEGNVYRILSDPVPRYYILLWIGITTPIFLLILTILGHCAVVRNCIAHHKQIIQTDSLWFMVLCTVIWSVPMLYFAILRPTVYNSWRHFQFIYGPFVLLAIYGVYTMQTLLKRRWLKNIGALVLLTCLTFTSVGIVKNHPTQYAYFNSLAGDAERLYEGDYWYLSVRDAIQRLLSSPDRNQQLPLTVYGFHHARLESFTVGKRQAITVLYEPIGESASYILINPSFERGTLGSAGYDALMEKLLKDYHELFSVKSYNTVIMRVLERNTPTS